VAQEWDVIIVGTGAGGGTLARTLAATGKQILLLERGDFLTRELDNWNAWQVFVDGRYISHDTWYDRDGKPFQPQVHYFVGGATKVYGAALYRLRPQDFGELRYSDGISPAWPVSYDEFEPYYSKAEWLYQVHGTHGTDPTEGRWSRQYPWPPVSQEPRIEHIFEDLERGGYHPFPAPCGILLDEADRPASLCIRCATCDGYPCLVHAKADADIIGVRPLLGMPNVTLLTGAEVIRLETDPGGRTVTGVVVNRGGRLPPGGQEKQGGVEQDLDAGSGALEGSGLEAGSGAVQGPGPAAGSSPAAGSGGQRRPDEVYRADIVVLAAGAANTAKILLRSASDAFPRGLANGSDQVGRNYMFHNSKAVVALGKEPNDTIFQKTLSVNDFYLPGEGREYPLGNIQMLGKSRSAAIRGEEGHLAKLAPTLSLDEVAHHAVDFWLTTEDLPKPDNRITVDSDGNIHLSYTPGNETEAAGLYEEFKTMLNHIGLATHHVLHKNFYLSMNIPVAGVAHQAGTCRFGTDPATSVLDVSCKAHELDNLYVADTSFFPSIGAVNPGLTAIANAIRVGEHIAERLGVAGTATGWAPSPRQAPVGHSPARSS
jgi:choline dehydrogenase-like flavoprotein